MPTTGEHPAALTAPPMRRGLADNRFLLICGLAVVIALGAAVLAEVLVALINLFTNIAFYGTLALTPSSPAGNSLGGWVILVPIGGALIVGLMARFGSPAIRGHGIPEVMERILTSESRIPPRLTILKPVGTAISIGTGGPFGAEGPIIATGGALGSMMGQALRVTADERKVLLAAGAAAGMSAIFGAPISATILAVELLLFEYRSRSLAPVALACAAAAAVRVALHGADPVFPMEIISTPTGAALTAYTVIGVFIGALGVGITRTLYRIEDAFERLPIHWMWWPAIGGIVIGVMGWISPLTLGVGYENISGLLEGSLAGQALLVLVLCKLVSWSIALGSGTAGGTLAPLFTIGGGAGVLVGSAVALVLPELGIDPRVAGLVGMAAAFTGASRALLASVVFAFEATRQPAGLLPLLAGCTGAYLISLRTMKETIMTERLARRGTPVISEYSADFLARVLVQDRATSPVITLRDTQTIAEVRAWLRDGSSHTHQGFPIVSDAGQLVGVLTRRDLLVDTLDQGATLRTLIRRPAVAVKGHHTLREASDLMVHTKVGRLPVLADDGRVVGILTRSDIIAAHERRLDEGRRKAEATLFG